MLRPLRPRHIFQWLGLRSRETRVAHNHQVPETSLLPGSRSLPPSFGQPPQTAPQLSLTSLCRHLHVIVHALDFFRAFPQYFHSPSVSITLRKASPMSSGSIPFRVSSDPTEHPAGTNDHYLSFPSVSPLIPPSCSFRPFSSQAPVP